MTFDKLFLVILVIVAIAALLFHGRDKAQEYRLRELQIEWYERNLPPR